MTNDIFSQLTTALTDERLFTFLFVGLVGAQLAELRRLFKESILLRITSLLAVLVALAVSIFLFVEFVFRDRPHTVWDLAFLMLLFIAALSYVLTFSVEEWGHLLTSANILGPNWVKWLDIVYVACVFFALFKAINNPALGLQPSDAVDKVAPLFLAAAISLRITKAVTEIFELDKEIDKRWYKKL
jgi:hypothetical protein